MSNIIIAETVQGVYTAIKFSDIYCQDEETTLIVPDKLLAQTKIFCSGRNYQIISLMNVLPNRLSRYFFRLLRICFTNKNFTAFYNRDLEKMPSYKRILASISIFLPLNIGCFLVNKMQSLYSSKTLNDASKIYYVTPNFHPELISKYSQKTSIIMESWDHFYKLPIYSPDVKVFTWNSDLASDLFRVNNKFFKIQYMAPLKLVEPENMKEAEHQYMLDSSWVSKLKSGVLYPMALNDNDNPEAYSEELVLIKKLSQYFKFLGLKILVKAKPGSGPDGFSELEIDDNIELLPRYESRSGLEFLNAEYHSYRYQLISQARFVVNLSTTFALDAAYAGRGFLQLNISNLGLNSLERYAHNFHVEKYLLRACGSIRLDTQPSSCEELESIHTKNGSTIRDWLSCHD